MAVTSQPASSPQTMTNPPAQSPSPKANSPPASVPVAPKTQGAATSGTPSQIPEKESAFKKWWFWLIIALIVLGGAGVFYYLSYMR